MNNTIQRISSVLNVTESSIHHVSGNSYQVNGKLVLVSDLQPVSAEKFVGLTTQKVLECDSVLIFIEENHLTPRAALHIPGSFFTVDLEKFYGDEYRLLFTLEYVDFSGWHLNLRNGQKESMASYELSAYQPTEIMEKIKQVQSILHSHLNSEKQ